jgi:two-component system, OmpR family, response regulator MprA
MAGSRANTVLVVEDDPDIREVVETFLRGEGFEVEVAQDGAQAIQAIDDNRPPPGRLCLVLLDMMLPKANGLAVLGHLAARGGDVPIVAMSANRHYLEAATQAGAHDTMTKPFDLDTLAAVVHRCCPH